MKRSEKILAAGALVAMLASSAIAVAWPGGGIGYPNTMIFDTWFGRTTAQSVVVGAGGSQATLRVKGTSNDAILTGDGGTGAGLRMGSATFDRASSGNAEAGTTGAFDVVVGQIAGTTKQVINFPTGDGAGTNAIRMSIDSDKVKITTSPGTSTGVLVGADSGSLHLVANASGGGEWDLLSGGGITTSNPVTIGAGSNPIQNDSFGSITLSGGAGTATVVSGVTCVCTDSTAVAAVKCSVAATTLSAAGTTTDVIKYWCFR